MDGRSPEPAGRPPLHVAIISWHFPPGPASGLEFQAEAWAKRLSATSRVTVITTRVPGLPSVETRDGFMVRRLKGSLTTQRVHGLPRALLRAATPEHIRRLRQTLTVGREIERYLHSMQHRPDVLLCFATYHAHLAGAASRRLGIPVVAWIRSEAEYRLRSLYQRRFLLKVLADAAAVYVQSEVGRADLLAELERVSPAHVTAFNHKFEVIGNGVDLPDPTPRNADGPVLTVGRLVPSKGHDIVIAACAELGRPLVIAGRGPERDSLEEKAAALGADVRFVGFADREALAKLYRSASAVVLASQHEGMPNVLLEAMAYARPVIATPVGGIPDLIIDDVNGKLVPPRDPSALAAALDRLFAEPETAERLAAAARATVAERFVWEVQQTKLEEALERVVSCGPVLARQPPSRSTELGDCHPESPTTDREFRHVEIAVRNEGTSISSWLGIS